MIGTARYLINLGRNSIRSGLDWGDTYDKLSNLQNELNEKSGKSLIGANVSQEEFATRFHHLCIAKYACGIAFLFSLITGVFEKSTSGEVISFGTALLFFLMLIQYSYKSWVAEFIWVKWEKRLVIKKPRFSKFVTNVLSNPIVIFSLRLH